MGDAKDLEDVAKSTDEDFYTLLGVSHESTDAEIKRAYRQTSLKYHPDKNPDDQAASDKFILIGIARDILLDTKLKSEYDTQRLRKKERKLENDLMDSKRRKMKEDLEAREREARAGAVNLKRKRQDEMNEAEKREDMIRRLAEDGKRRRMEEQERRKKLQEDEEKAFQAKKEAQSAKIAPGQSPEIDRTVKVAFSKEGETASWDKEHVSKLFEKYGKIDSAVVGKDKRVKAPGEKHRKAFTSLFLVYTRIDHAYSAVLDGKRDFPLIESTSWAGKEPDLTSPWNGQISVPSTPKPTTPHRSNFRASLGSSFGSSIGTSGTPAGTPKFSFSPATHSLEEHTMMRLKRKHAEKMKLEEQIRAQEAAEDAEQRT
ncbi:DnaJ-domain-containing protein [Polyplosphaeria fusca]|uniref:DnaJ-domain-containing protein n=1 Tax=Polyplosphaeria fusca TaxID=682080 RepID=A0A9P4R0I5_9PLEO|nr:DnaJ-domain-containing protein [Polyplosphaeria fusca]